MIIPNPPGNTFYIGADSFDAFYDAAGYLWFADDFKSSQPFQAKLYRMKDGVMEQMPMAEPINGAIRLNWTPLGLSVSGSYQASEGAPVTARFFMVPEFANWTLSGEIPPVVPPTTNVDQTARDMATAAQNTANTAQATANTANNTANSAKGIANAANTTANNALGIANSKPTLDQVWGKINDRLFGLISAIETGNRSDPLDAKWQDVLFKKVNDWIYGFCKDHGLIK